MGSKRKKKKKIGSLIRDIISWIVTVISVFMMIFTVISVTTLDRFDRNLFGYKMFIVLSDSMAATDFDAGDIVVSKNVDPAKLQEGDIIVYQSLNPDSYGKAVTHKIRRLTTDAAGNPGFITYGTTTGVDDGVIVTYNFVIGQYRFRIPKLGLFLQFLKTTPGYIVCILVPFLILIAIQAGNTIKAFRSYKKEEMAEIQREKERIKAEREESARLMQEIAALREQLNQQQNNTDNRF